MAVWEREYGSMGMGEWQYVCLCVQDQDKDSKLSLDDYKTAVQKERLLIEAFGPCLPPRQKVEEFSDILFNPSTSSLS